MPLGLSKLFVIFLILSIGFGYATENWKNSLVLMGGYVIFTIVWRYLTR